jgi:hypothetical protein
MDFGNLIREALDLIKDSKKKRDFLNTEENYRKNHAAFREDYESPYSTAALNRQAAISEGRENRMADTGKAQLESERRSQESINRYNADIYRTDVGERLGRYQADKGVKGGTDDTIVSTWMENNPTATADQILQFRSRLNAKPPANVEIGPVKNTPPASMPTSRAVAPMSPEARAQRGYENKYSLWDRIKPITDVPKSPMSILEARRKKIEENRKAQEKAKSISDYDTWMKQNQ